MTVEHLETLKTKYTAKRDYFKKLDFNNLASDFDEMVKAVEQMIEYVKGTANS